MATIQHDNIAGVALRVVEAGGYRQQDNRKQKEQVGRTRSSSKRPFRNRLSDVQLLQQRLGLPQVERIKSFGEPAVDRRKKITGFAAPVLFAPEARQADRCPQFEELCALELRYRKCLMIAPLGRGWIACGIQQIAAQPMQLSLAVPLFGRLDYPRSLGEAIQSIGRLPDHSVGLGEPHKRKRRTCNSSGST